jgi:hypothetical protein
MSSKFPRTSVLAFGCALALAAGAATAQVPVQPLCAFQIDPAPAGPSARPLDDFADPQLFANPGNSNDYHWVHSGEHLQGNATTQKFAACAFYDLPDSDAIPDLSGLRTALVVNNPNPVGTANVVLTFRDAAGVPFAFRSVAIPAEGFFLAGADVFSPALGGPGFGSIEAQSNLPIVGATIHHLPSGAITIGGISVIDPDVTFGVRPGGNTMQQLQESQGATTLLGGPYPFTNTAAEDFLNGLLPFDCILNASNTPTTLTISRFISGGVPLASTITPLPAFGLFLDTALWSVAEPFYLSSPAPFSFNVMSVASATAGASLVGETIQADFFSNGAGSNLNLGGRFRLASATKPISTSCQVINPEVVRTTTTPPVATYMLVANGSTSPATVTTQFFDRDSTGTPFLTRVDAVPALTAVRITPSTGAFPATSFAGWARIRSNQGGLFGWTAREINQQVPPTIPNHFRKAYGEVLSGGSGREPGRGLPVDVAGTPFLREVAPLNRVGDDGAFPFDWWPGYAIADNTSAANIGAYVWRWFAPPGAPLSTAAFAGLPFARTSFTHVDPQVLIFQNLEVSGRFDRTQGSNIEGLDVIGDPLEEWNIPGLFEPGTPGGTFKLPKWQPGDVVPVDPVGH